MAFSTIFIIVIICYVLFYAGMIVYDLFFKKDATDLLPKQEDEEVDISDEVGRFLPILIEKDKQTGHNEMAKTALQPKETHANPDTEESTKASQTVPTTETPDTEPSNRKSLSDRGPTEPTETERNRIRELVEQKRKELKAEQKEEDSKASQGALRYEPNVKASTRESSNQKPQTTLPLLQSDQEPTVSDHQKADNQREKTESKPPKAKPKTVKPEQPRPALAYIDDLFVEIDEEAGKTRLCGAKTAERVQEDYQRIPLDQVLKATAKMGSLIKIIKDARQPDDEEKAAIEMAKHIKRPKPVEFEI